MTRVTATKPKTKNALVSTKSTAEIIAAPKKRRSSGFIAPDEVDLPPLRAHQEAARQAFLAGKRRQLLVWHRRAGKDFFGMRITREEIIKEPGSYWHMFPTHAQAKRAIWTGRDARLKGKFIELAFGGLYSTKPNDTDMYIEMDNGASWQLLGSDNYNRHVGANPRGVVISEWALCDPKALAFIRPILRENGGWLILITTYRGRNHAYQMMQQLQGNDKWYLDIKTVNDTFREDGTPIISAEDIEEERREGMSESIIRQEYYCDPVAVLEGAVYGAPLVYLESAKAIAPLSYDPFRPVWCIWSFAHYPAAISYVLVQPHMGGGASVLRAENFYYQDVTEAFATFSRMNRYPIARHAVFGADEAMDIFDQAITYGFAPDFIADLETTDRISKTTLWLRASQIDSTQNVLLDSLRSFRVTDDVESDEIFSADESMQYLVSCIEAAAIYQAGSLWAKSSWSKGRNYKAADRTAI